MMFRVDKPNPIRKAIFDAPPELVGGVFAFGRIGSGKTTSCMSLLQKYHDHPGRRYKIIDLYGGERKEQNFWCFPSRDLDYWKKVEKKLNLKAPGPKQYQVKLLYPYFKSHTPDKLPSNPPHVKSLIFTIPFDSLTIDDLSLVIGTVSEQNVANWNKLKEEVNKKDNPAMILHKAKKHINAKSLLLRSIIEPLCEQQFFQSENYSLNLDMKIELRERETITILSLDFVPEEYRIFIMGWVLRQVSTLINEGRVQKRNIIYIREAAEFFRATDNSLMPDKMKIFRMQLANFIRYGRKGMHCFLDCQSPSETRGLVNGSQDLTIIGRMTSEADREEACGVFYRDNLMTRSQIQDLSLLNPGQMFIAEIGKKVRKRYMFLPRTMYWTPRSPPFFTLWEKLVGKWDNIKDTKDNINEEYKVILEEIKEKERLEEMQKKERETIAKAKQEQEAEEELTRKEAMKRRVKDKFKTRSIRRETFEDEEEQEAEEEEIEDEEDELKTKEEMLDELGIPYKGKPRNENKVQNNIEEIKNVNNNVKINNKQKQELSKEELELLEML